MRLLFPEAEVTRSLSSNLLKRGCTSLNTEDMRVIDTNALVAKKIEELQNRMNAQDNQGFVAGIPAETLDMEHLSEEEANQLVAGKVMKAGEEAAEVTRRAREEADTVLEEARAEARQIREEAKAQIQAEKEQAIQQAREQGYRDGAAKAEQEAKAQSNELNKKSKQLEKEYQQLIDELEPRFIDTLTGIYEHIFHVELGSYREIISYLIQNTIRKIEGNKDFIIHVSKEDYPYVTMQKKQITACTTAPNSTVEIVEDVTLSKNQCLIESEGGIFDCGLGAQLSELSQKLRLLSYEKE